MKKMDLEKSLHILLGTDGYKLSHRVQYPEGTTFVYANITPRKSLSPFLEDYVVVYGVGFVVKQLKKEWQKHFFGLSKKDFKVLKAEYKKKVENYLGVENYSVDHIEELYNYGSLPLDFWGIEDFKSVSFGTPIMVLYNNDPKFFWLVNYIESYLSCNIWQIITSANISKRFYETLYLSYCVTVSDKVDLEFLRHQVHDFSYRGMSSSQSAIYAGLGHLAYFNGTDNIPAMLAYHRYFGKKPINSIPATEHSVMCAGGKENEFQTYKRLIDLYPKGTLSIVSDTWNLWNVLDNYLPKLKDKILNRDGKIVIRPDSGDPQEIILKSLDKLEVVFGTKLNSSGYKELPPQIGLIYGDSITLERAKNILNAMGEKGWASNNVIFGVGSFTYQYNTRDTLGFAMKTTYIEVDGKGRNIFKDPITDDGTKKSAKGIVYASSFYVEAIANKYINSTNIKKFLTEDSVFSLIGDYNGEDFEIEG